MKSQTDWKKIRDCLKKRSSLSFGACESSSLERPEVTFYLSNSDEGVCRNGGRRGSSYGPQVILHELSKFNQHAINVPWKKVCASENVKSTHFDEYQVKQSINIAQHLSSISDCGKFIHLGGGHDHVYSLIKAIHQQLLETKQFKKIKIYNIDAHTDTRPDPWAHSGTPFSQASSLLKEKLELIQLGIHDQSNAPSNFKLSDDHPMTIITKEKLDSWEQNRSLEEKLSSLFQHEEGVISIFSLDADAIEATSMEAVSAVNSNGLSLQIIRKMIQLYKDSTKNQVSFLGIYEYNPLYDNLSNKGAKILSELILRFVQDL
jgi:formiminoglutamase